MKLNNLTNQQAILNTPTWISAAEAAMSKKLAEEQMLKYEQLVAWGTPPKKEPEFEGSIVDKINHYIEKEYRAGKEVIECNAILNMPDYMAMMKYLNDQAFFIGLRNGADLNIVRMVAKLGVPVTISGDFDLVDSKMELDIKTTKTVSLSSKNISNLNPGLYQQLKQPNKVVKYEPQSHQFSRDLLSTDLVREMQQIADQYAIQSPRQMHIINPNDTNKQTFKEYMLGIDPYRTEKK